MNRTILLGALLLLAIPGSWGEAYGNAGTGFGSSIRSLMSARRAGTGGVALDNLGQYGTSIATDTIFLDQGLRWFGAGMESGFTEMFRFGAEAFYFTSSDVTGTYEKADGTYGGESGAESVNEIGGRLNGHLVVWKSRSWTTKAIARISGLYQELPGIKSTGFGIEAGGEGELGINPVYSLRVWGLGGPIGKGASRNFANQWTLGTGVYATPVNGWLARYEGYAAGVEGTFLGEGVTQAGIGLIYWIGRPEEQGLTWFLRGGARYVEGSAQTARMQGGLGVLWSLGDGGGLQFDFALVPLGELGYFKYATLSFRLSEGEKSPPVEVTPELIPPATVESSQPIPEEDVAYFYPERGDKIRIKIQLEKSSKLIASLLDQNGYFIMFIQEESKVDAGEHVIEWDGNFQHGAPAPLGLVYWIRVSCSGTTKDYKVMPKGDFR